MRYFFGILFSLSTFFSFSQFFSSKEYDWEEANYETVTVDDSTDLYILLNKRIFRYFFDDDEFSEEYLYHRKMHINSSDAIEGLNTVYISQGADAKNLLQFKARVINQNGTIKELKEKDILTGVDEDTEQQYTYFALEGLQVGSQVEYYYIKRIPPDYKGTVVEIENYYPVHRFELDVISPPSLEFAAKVYNVDYEFTTDTTLPSENRIHLYIDSIAEQKGEPQSFREANLGRAIFKLDKNLYQGKGDLVSYSYIAQDIVNLMNVEMSKSEQKVIKKIGEVIEKYDESESSSRARKVEDYIKSHYNYVESGNPVLRDLKQISYNKAFNGIGALKLYTQLFKTQDISYKVMYTCDRSEQKFDGDFQSDVFLRDVLLYIEDDNEYLDYTNPLSRIGYINSLNRGIDALAIEEVGLNENVVALSTVERIPAKEANFSMDSMRITAHFGENMLDNSLSVRRIFTGYSAMAFQPLFQFLVEEEQRKDIEEFLLKYVDDESEIDEINIKNGEANLLGVKPLKVTGKLTNTNFIESAGPNYLFKIGKLIGPQVEMYQDETKERRTPVESDHARTYERVISFKVPEGYELSGLDALKMDEKLMYQEEISARFLSDYAINGNQVEVKIQEFYNEVWYPKEMFEDYRKVINAAADFNKKTLLLKKI